MKKILSFIALSITFLSFWFAVNSAYAHTIAGDKDKTVTAEDAIKVRVTEKIPGANCGRHIHGDSSVAVTQDTVNRVDPEATGSYTYECEVKKGFWQITLMLGNMIKYFTFIASLWGVLFIVINGILYSMGGIDSGWKDEAKKRITKTLIGLAILLLSWVILNAIAPWIYTI